MPRPTLQPAQLALAMILALPAYARVGLPDLSMLQAEAEAGDLSPPVISVAAPTAPVSFHLAIGYRCPVEMKGSSVMVSIAETSDIFDLRDSPAGKVIQISVPLRQLQWFLPTDQNCATMASQRAPDSLDENGQRLFRVSAGSVGYATLTCTGEKGATATATTGTGLDVWLSCPAEATAAQPIDPSAAEPVSQPPDVPTGETVAQPQDRPAESHPARALLPVDGDQPEQDKYQR